MRYGECGIVSSPIPLLRTRVPTPGARAACPRATRRTANRYNARVRRVHLYRDGERIAGPLEVAETFLERTRGLLGRGGLEGRAGMVIERCGMIHTWFMRFPIDAVYLSRDGTVRKVSPGVKPWRFSGAPFAHCTVELRAGAASEAGLEAGQVVEFRPDGVSQAPPETL